MMDQFLKYINLIRAKQWVKNGFLTVPLVFSSSFTNIDLIFRVTLAFISFSFLASCMYIFNDIKDIEKDKLHPKKKFRALASGNISKSTGIKLAILLALISFGIGAYLGIEFIGILMIYILFNLIYTLYTKHLPVWDIVFLASFYIIRIFAGGIAIDVPITSWLMLTTLFAALFIGSGKRYIEFNSEAKGTRKVLSYYSNEFLSYSLYLSSFCTILFYVLYTTTKSVYYEISSVFVIVGFLNYFYHLFNKDIDEDPTAAVLKSKSLLLTLALWLIYICTIIFLNK